MPAQIDDVLAERVIRMLGEGRSVHFTAMSNRLTNDQVLDLAVRHGHPDTEKLLWSADIMKRNLTVAARAAAPAQAAPETRVETKPVSEKPARIKPGPKPRTTPREQTVPGPAAPSAPVPSGFQIFARPRTNNTMSPPAVNLSKSGQITVNKSANLLLGDPEEVEVLWDPEKRVIGIRAVPARTDGSFRLSRGSTGSRAISARAFFEFIGIDWTTSHLCPAELRDGILHVDTTKDA